MATIINYLSLTGLQNYDVKIKAFIDSQIEAGVANSFKYVNLVDGALKFYTVNPIADDTVADFEIELPEQDLSHLMQLVKNATSGNVAILNDLGQVTDGNLALTDIATKTEVEAVQTAVDELGAYVGTIPEDATSTNIIAYVNEKAREVLESATGGSSESAASVKLALDEYKALNDPKVQANADAIAALETADESQIERLDVLESQIIGLSGAMHFEGVKDAIPEDVADYADGDVIIVGNKEYVLNGGTFVEFGDASANAEAITELTTRMGTAENDIDALQAAIGTVEEGKTVVEMLNEVRESATAYTDEKIAGVTETINTLSETVTNLSSTHATDKAELVAADEAMAADIAELQSVQHVAITDEEISALFAESAE